MFINERKVIGIFINKFDNAFQKEVCSEISIRAKQEGFHALFFQTYANNFSKDEYEPLEQNMFHLAPIEDLDAIIILPDTFMIASQREFLIASIIGRKSKDCPVFSLRTTLEGCYSVLAHGEQAFKDIICHVIDYHHATKISYMGGPLEQYDARVRLQSYKEVMMNRQLPIRENAIFHGNFWTTQRKEAIDFFFSNPDDLPDAIICANDYMAVSLIYECTERGIAVPNDVIITGFDSISESTCCSPSLTTIFVDNREHGRTVVALIRDYFSNVPIYRTTYIETEPVYRESCGCVSSNDIKYQQIRNEMLIYNEQQHQEQIDQYYFSIDISAAKSLEQLNHAILQDVPSLGRVRHFFTCLCIDEERDVASTKYSRAITQNVFTDMAYVNGEKVNLDRKRESELIFYRSKLLPDWVKFKEPESFFFTLLHNRDLCFGYTIISFEDGDIYDFNYQGWTISISNAFNDVVGNIRLERALHKNEVMSVTDALTGLYNRRGFEIYSTKALGESTSISQSVEVVTIDLDKLKSINDNYGHEQGDFAIKTVAKTIEHTLGHRGIAARTGGDEFVVLMITVAGDEPFDFVSLFRENLEIANQTSGKEYPIRASVGSYRNTSISHMSLEEMMRQSDDELYVEKRRKKQAEKDGEASAR